MPDLLPFLDAVDRARPTDELPSPDACRALRQRAGMPLRHVAVALGIDPATLSAWERGTHVPRRRKHEWRKVIAVLQERVEDAVDTKPA